MLTGSGFAGVVLPAFGLRLSNSKKLSDQANDRTFPLV